MHELEKQQLIHSVVQKDGCNHRQTHVQFHVQSFSLQDLINR